MCIWSPALCKRNDKAGCQHNPAERRRNESDSPQADYCLRGVFIAAPVKEMVKKKPQCIFYRKSICCYRLKRDVKVIIPIKPFLSLLDIIISKKNGRGKHVLTGNGGNIHPKKKMWKLCRSNPQTLYQIRYKIMSNSIHLRTTYSQGQRFMDFNK